MGDATAEAPVLAPAALAEKLGERIAPPAPGRVHRGRRRVRLSDVNSAGLVRLDALARYLQDVAVDDVRDAGIEDAVAWVVRRTTVIAPRRPVYGEELELATWCSGVGAALAERRTTVHGDRGASVEVVALWVSLDRATLRPVAVAEEHFQPYKEQAGERRVRSRLFLPGEPGREAGPVRGWPLRDADFDLFDHVNNSISWAAAEEESARWLVGAVPTWGQVEYRRPIERGEEPTLIGRRCGGGGEARVWLLGRDGAAASTARLGLGTPSAG